MQRLALMIITIPQQRISLTENQFILAGFCLLPFAQILLSALVGALFIDGPASGWHRYGGVLFSLKLALFQLLFAAGLAYLVTPRLKRSSLKNWEVAEIGVWTVLASSLGGMFLWWVTTILVNDNASFSLLLSPRQWFQLPLFTLFYYLNGGISLVIGGLVSWYLSRHNPFSP